VGALVAEAVTVTTDAEGWLLGFVGDAEVDPELDPQAVVMRNVARRIVESRNARFLRVAVPANPAKEIAGTKRLRNSNPWGKVGGEFCDVPVEETFTVKVVDAVLAGLMEGGLKLQVAPVGNPEQARVRAWLNPSTGAVVMVNVPDAPVASVREDLLRERE
jgi:hypothetical protein